MATPAGGGVNIMDLHGKIAIDDAFNIWIGRMLVPSDRANFSGVWFASPWFYPGFHFAGPPVGPRQGPQGRNDGLTAWGQFAGGMFKYYAGAYNLQNSAGGALISGRLNLSLLTRSPATTTAARTTARRTCSRSASAASSKRTARAPTTTPSSTRTSCSRRTSTEGGVLDLEGAFYKYMGDGEPVDYSSSCSRAG